MATTFNVPLQTYTGSIDTPSLTVGDTGRGVTISLAPTGFTPANSFVWRWQQSNNGGFSWFELGHSGTNGTVDGTGGMTMDEAAFQRSLVPAAAGQTYLVRAHIDIIGALTTAVSATII